MLNEPMIDDADLMPYSRAGIVAGLLLATPISAALWAGLISLYILLF